MGPALRYGLRKGTAGLAEKCFDRSYVQRSQGARLIGTYDSQVAFGQSRVLLVWTRLIMPNARSIVLERQPGADTAGYSGLEDDVDNHWKELLGAAALSTLLAVGTEVNSGTDASGSNSAINQALRRGARTSLNRPAGGSPQSQYPANVDDPSGISGPSDCQSGSCT